MHIFVVRRDYLIEAFEDREEAEEFTKQFWGDPKPYVERVRYNLKKVEYNPDEITTEIPRRKKQSD